MMKRAVRPLAVILGATGLLSACAPMPIGSSVQTMPGPGKSFEAFQVDTTSCKLFAGQQVAGQAEQANRAFAIGLGVQQQYDNVFSQCMYSRGNEVAGFAPVSVGPTYSGDSADPMVRSVQRELIRLRYLGGRADGVMSAHLGSAISSFEASNGMQVDGMPSYQVLARLRAAHTRTVTASAPRSATAPAAPTAPPAFVPPVATGAAVSATTAAPSADSFVAPVKTP